VIERAATFGRTARSAAAEPRPEVDEALDIGIGDDILIVDDSPANLVAIESALAPLGRKLVLVHSGVEALAKLLEQDFALILLDVAMPGITGIETARLIRTRERSRGTPILFVTGMTWQDEAIDEAYEAGGFDFLIKPVRPEVLRAKARVFLKLQERTRALRRQADELRASQAQLYEHELHEQRIRFESELLDTNLQQLAQGERRQHELAGIIGNELLNPLQTLQMAFDLLREHPNAGAGERIHSLVEQRLTHITRLVKVLIDVAQVAAGQLQLRPSTFNLSDLALHAIDECRPIADARKLVIRFEPDGEPAMVIADRARLQQAVATLIEYAARTTGEAGTLVTTSQIAAGDVVLRVANGHASAADLQPRGFDMFVGDTAAGGRTLNLGLTLVKRLVELQDGTIRAWSDSTGKSTAFEIRLPLAPQDVELPLDAESGLDPLIEPTARMPALERPEETESPEARELGPDDTRDMQ
jgi:CheY-like chemotaxis protein